MFAERLAEFMQLEITTLCVFFTVAFAVVAFCSVRQTKTKSDRSSIPLSFPPFSSASSLVSLLDDSPFDKKDRNDSSRSRPAKNSSSSHVVKSSKSSRHLQGKDVATKRACFAEKKKKRSSSQDSNFKMKQPSSTADSGSRHTSSSMNETLDETVTNNDKANVECATSVSLFNIAPVLLQRLPDQLWRRLPPLAVPAPSRCCSPILHRRRALPRLRSRCAQLPRGPPQRRIMRLTNFFFH